MATIEQEMKASQKLTDQNLSDRLMSGVLAERGDLGAVLVFLAEFDRRRLGPSKGYPSLFVYCTTVLGYSSAAAARRIATARAGRKFPSLLAMVRKGELHLEGAAMLAQIINSENRRKLLRQARGRSLEEIARIIATHSPQAAKRDHVRIVSAPETTLPGESTIRTAGIPGPEPRSETADSAAGGGWDSLFGPSSHQAEAPSSMPTVSTKEIFRVSFDADGETMEMLRRAQEILRHKFPKAELNLIVKSALDMLLAHEDRDRREVSKRHEKKVAVNATATIPGRRVPEVVKQTAWNRDGGKCTWVGNDGVVCGTRAWMEFDHIHPAALGGTSGDPDNIRLLCREHNQLAARLIFSAKAASEPVLTG